MTTLQLKNIVKRYKSQTVLDDLSLDVADGERLVLFGPSGAGKTVLLRLVAGVIDPDEGRVLIGGEDMTEVDAEHRGVGMAFQNFALFPHMSAFDNIASALTSRKSSKESIAAGVQKVAKLLKIDHVLSHHPKALSNGQKQRTALARALVGSPPLLLLDDPLRNVDAKLRFEMRLELPRLLASEGATVVYVTQDYKEAMALGDRIAVMSQGSIHQIGTPGDIYNAPADIEIARLFGDPTINLLDVVPQRGPDGAFVELSNVRFRLPNFGAEIVGKSCVLGLRPETIAFTEASALGAIPVTVEAETPLNEKTVTLTLTARGREILVSRPAGTPGPVAGPAHIAVNGRAALLFDKESGRLMRPAELTSKRNGEAA
ncbi:ABC transporter ATP-binding protein [Sinorhizobium numidicum]|uniref:ABC transporter ATP-binding protein n=1 Tax=Sinorhizobium numidicum TaxID=680248 RepID=A0ABY8CYW3_9HYPH|nr:ABC transporter ATP-binding protein [Sinorhizobium numidicum]WEX76406.1 ABC transporter ATP-binding protein [Sinorhizobium numidicum]WEX83067.1 ABC transporter ATP-binding protein [Sinorhizobium numidicum]